MKLKKTAMYLGAVALVVGLAAGCSTTTEDKAAAVNITPASVETSIADAKAALKEAEQGDYAWRDTGKFIKQAEEAAAAGDLEKASKLSNKALEQSELAKIQKAEQEVAVKERFK